MVALLCKGHSRFLDKTQQLKSKRQKTNNKHLGQVLVSSLLHAHYENCINAIENIQGIRDIACLPCEGDLEYKLTLHLQTSPFQINCASLVKKRKRV